ncbi:MAG TPA: hypothetical protein VIY54_06815 [Steroidobacteraceae bacterium]
MAAVLGAMLSGVVAMQARATSQPAAPPQLCVNNHCSSGSTANGPIKWNPGHYMASNGVIYPGKTLANFEAEMQDIGTFDNVVGYRVFITWGALEPAKGRYDFSVLDAMLALLKTRFNKPKHLVVALLPASFGGQLGNNDGKVVPVYLQQDSAYGPSPTPGMYGWWGASSHGVSSSAYSAALWRPAVMNRFIALLQAMGAHYNSDPNFEAVMFQEDSGPPGAATPKGAPQAPDYSSAAMVAQYEAMMTAATAAFPNTSFVMENTWGTNSVPDTENLEVWMVKNRIAPGSADTIGQSVFDKYGFNGLFLNFGMQTYVGAGVAGSNYTGGDLRLQAHAMMDVEADDLAGAYFGRWGGPFSALDVINALNQTYQASHAFWTRLIGTEPVRGGGTVNSEAPGARWSNLGPVINAHPLLHTDYPPNYPK